MKIILAMVCIALAVSVLYLDKGIDGNSYVTGVAVGVGVTLSFEICSTLLDLVIRIRN